MKFYQRDLTDIHSFTTDEVLFVLDEATRMKRAISSRDVNTVLVN